MIAMRSSGDSSGPITPLPMRAILEFVAGVAVAGLGDVEERGAARSRPGRSPPSTGSNCLLPVQNVSGRSECGDSSKIQVGHGTVVQERGDGPDPIQRTGLVDQVVAHRHVARVAAACPRGMLFRGDPVGLEELAGDAARHQVEALARRHHALLEVACVGRAPVEVGGLMGIGADLLDVRRQ